jgi:hypothetical protein
VAEQTRLFSLLFEASAATLLDIAAHPKHLGAQLGFLSILHTWGQTLTPHPHIHCVVPGGGLAPDHSRWIASRSSFLLPVKVLSRVFRGKFLAGPRLLFARDQLRFFGQCRPLHEEKHFAHFLRTLYQQDWVVYAKPPFGGPPACAALSGALHAPRCHLQPPPALGLSPIAASILDRRTSAFLQTALSDLLRPVSPSTEQKVSPAEQLR